MALKELPIFSNRNKIWNPTGLKSAFKQEDTGQMWAPTLHGHPLDRVEPLFPRGGGNSLSNDIEIFTGWAKHTQNTTGGTAPTPWCSHQGSARGPNAGNPAGTREYQLLRKAARSKMAPQRKEAQTTDPDGNKTKSLCTPQNSRRQQQPP